jgi:S1-C subfamily serine protease
MDDWMAGPPGTRRGFVRRGAAAGVGGRSSRPGWLAILAVCAVTAILASVVTVSFLAPFPALAPPSDSPATGATSNTSGATPTAGAQVAVSGTPRDQQSVVEAAARSAGPAVLSVDVTGPGPVFGADPGTITVTISGTVVAPDGLIVTVWHLVASATSLKVALPDGRNLTAQIKATDEAHDLVVIRIDAAKLPAGLLANDAKLEIGQTLLALGGPDGAASASVSSGVLSATNRTIGVRDPTTGRDDPIDGLIQTDASINFHNEGGPLVDVSGAVVGIDITSAEASQGIGFAVPIAAARAVILQAQSAP